ALRLCVFALRIFFDSCVHFLLTPQVLSSRRHFGTLFALTRIGRRERKMKNRVGLLLIVGLCAVLLPALSGADGYSESVSVDLVNVYLTATDDHNHFVNDLRPDELTLTENGIVRQID